MIHGRFQPFHNGHLEYMRGAADRSDELWVGITNPDPARIRPEASDPARHLPESNPYTYDERLLMVKAAAPDLGLDAASVHVIPFPVNEPDLWQRVRARRGHAVPAALLGVGRREARAAAGGGLRGRDPRPGCGEGDLRERSRATRSAPEATGRRSSRRGRRASCAGSTRSRLLPEAERSSPG